MKRYAITALLAAGFAAGAALADPVVVNYALRSTAGLSAEGDRSLGSDPASDDRQVGYLNLAPRLLIEFAPSWSAYVRARAFLPTGSIAPLDTGAPVNDSRQQRSFIGLSELFLQYRGLTSYPGEALNLGRQHIRQPGSEWWDQDIDALRWLVDTSDRRFDVGVARQLASYRSDGVPVLARQRRRSYLFAGAGADWQPGQRVGVQLTHAVDDGRGPAIGDAVGADSKLADVRLTWLGLSADNGYHDARRRQPLSYWGEAIGMAGRQTLATVGPDGLVDGRDRQRLLAWAANAGLRWRPTVTGPFAVGGQIGHGSGGRRSQYQQTGVQSNTSSFAGTRALVNRYNEALGAELGNLRVASGYLSLNFEDQDLSAILSNFSRDDRQQSVITNGVTAGTVNTRRALGNGLDLIATHYFGRQHRAQRLLDSGDAYVAQQQRSQLSLRASMFDPGAAYGAGADRQYRVLLEATLWLD